MRHQHPERRRRGSAGRGDILAQRRGIELEEDRVGWGTDLNYDEIAQHPYNPDNFLPLFRAGWERRQPVR